MSTNFDLSFEDSAERQLITIADNVTAALLQLTFDDIIAPRAVDTVDPTHVASVFSNCRLHLSCNDNHHCSFADNKRFAHAMCLTAWNNLSSVELSIATHTFASDPARHCTFLDWQGICVATDAFRWEMAER